MKTAEEIKNKIALIEPKLEKIKSEIDKQLQVAFFDRDPYACQFLHLEEKKYSIILNELKWILNE